MALTLEPGAKLVVHSLGTPGSFQAFTPKLLSAVPRGSLAYLGLRGFDRVAARLLAVAGSQAGQFAKLISDNRAALKGEVAVVLLQEGRAWGPHPNRRRMCWPYTRPMSPTSITFPGFPFWSSDHGLPVHGGFSTGMYQPA